MKKHNEKLFEIAESLIMAANYVAPASQKNSKKGDEARALYSHLIHLYSHLIHALTVIAEMTGQKAYLMEKMKNK